VSLREQFSKPVNNTFNDEDGDAITNANVDSGFGRQEPLSSGFVDMTEAWRDDNENNVKTQKTQSSMMMTVMKNSVKVNLIT